MYQYDFLRNQKLKYFSNFDSRCTPFDKFIKLMAFFSQHIQHSPKALSGDNLIYSKNKYEW